MKIVRYLGLIGLAVFFYIVYSIGPGKIVAGLSKINPLFFAAALLMFFPMIWLKGFKQAMLVNAFGVRFPVLQSSKVWLIGFFFSLVSPGRAGDVLKSFYFAEKTGITTGHGVTAVVVERVFDLAVLFMFALTGFVVLSSYLLQKTDLVMPLLILFFCFLAACYVMTRKKIMLFLTRPFYRILVPARFKGKLSRAFHHFFEGISIYKRQKLFLVKVAGFTALTWAVGILQYYLLALSLGIAIPLPYLFAMIPVIEFLTILPIAFSGLGTREAGLIFFLGLIGISATAAVSFSLLILISVLPLGLIGFMFLQREKLARLNF